MALWHIGYAAIVVMAGFGAVRAQEAGDAHQGLLYASRHCTECHTIERGGWTSPNPDAPPFQALANTQGVSWIVLTAWLQSSHKSMPNLLVEPKDREDVIAYILSLKAKQP
ncbi:MAG TPA: c-type cytochrome [Hyphomicrobiales bacterium]|jgi:mono/diheme cytochrome c family protein